MNMKMRPSIIMIAAKMYHFHDESFLVMSLFMSGSDADADADDGDEPPVSVPVKQSRFVTNNAFSSSVQLSLFAQYEHASPSLHLQHVANAFSGKVTFSLGAIKPDLHTSSLTGLHPFGVTSIFRSPVCPISFSMFW
jgi:hypothetical protein